MGTAIVLASLYGKTILLVYPHPEIKDNSSIKAGKPFKRFNTILLFLAPQSGGRILQT